MNVIKKLLLLTASVFLLLPVDSNAQTGPFIGTTTVTASGQVVTIDVTRFGFINHSFTFTLATGSPTGISAVARCSKDYGVSYPFIFGTSTLSSDTLKMSEACTSVQFTMTYTGAGTFSLVYLGAPQSLNNVVMQSGVPGANQIAYFQAPGVIAANPTFSSNRSGGLSLGAPTGGDEGAGTINVAGGFYVNGVLVAGGGGTSPGGAPGSVQFNNAGSFGGLTAAQLTADINVFTTGLAGLVPASGGGTTNFLRADGTFAVPSGTGGGTVTTTGSPAAGQLAKFSGATSIVNGDLSGDCSTAGTLAINCTKTGGVSFAASATVDTTNASNITSGTLSAARMGPLVAGHTVLGNNTSGSNAAAFVQLACGDLSNGTASCSTDTTNASNISSGTLAAARMNPTVSAHLVLGNNTSGSTAASFIRLACADLSNASASCSTDATNASNITTGTLAAAQMNPTVSAHFFLGNNTGGSAAATFARLACADLSNSVPSCSIDATNAANITGTLTTRVNPRTNTVASSASITINSDTTDDFTVTAAAVAPTINAPSGTPVNGQTLLIRLKDNGTPRVITWNAIFRASTDLALSTTTTTSKTQYNLFVFNSTDTKWDLIAFLDNF